MNTVRSPLFSSHQQKNFTRGGERGEVDLKIIGKFDIRMKIRTRLKIVFFFFPIHAVHKILS